MIKIRTNNGICRDKMLASLKGKFRLALANKNVTELVNDEQCSDGGNTFLTVNAGAEILKHFQQQWVQLHTLNEVNCKNASVVSNNITDLSFKYHRSKQNISELNEWLISIPFLKESINNCARQMSEIYSVCDSLEKNLLELEDLIEQTEFEVNKAHHINQLKLYKQAKLGKR